MARRPTAWLSLLACAALIALAGRADTQATRLGKWPDHEFEFARLVYYDGGSCRFYDPCWSVDYPEAEHFFGEGVSRLTRVELGREGVMISLDPDDDMIFDYPWLYAVEVGYWRLSEQHAARLREYLLRGGFLMVDDFHGTRQWAGFESSMRRVFPDRPILEIPDADEVLHVLYNVDHRIQIPGIAALMNNVTFEDDGYDPHWRGIYDDKGRLMVAINHNMDLGDSWEHADDPTYPQEMTTLGLQFAVNYVIYALTH